MLFKGTYKFLVAHKALSMHKSCMGAENPGGAYLQQFRALMREMGLSWPEPSPSNATALGVLLALSYKWQVHLWFDISVLPQPVFGKWRLAFKPAPALPILLNQFDSVNDSTSYTAYWMGYYGDLCGNTTTSMNPHTRHDIIKDTRAMEGNVLIGLSQLIFTPRNLPAVFRLENIGDHSHNIPTATWIKVLQENIQLDPRLGASDDVSLRNEDLLKTVGEFFGQYPEPRLLRQFAWTFLQMYAPIAEPGMLLRHFGAKYKVTTYRSLFCCFHVEDTHKVLVLSIDLFSRMEENGQDAIRTGFQRLVSAAVKNVENTMWLYDRSKRFVGDKIASVQMRARPEKLEKHELEEIYKDYPSTEGSFGEHWMQARRIIRTAHEKVRHINDS
ncbi:hypothetical protein V5799_007479 [Amblyomma americanum]|uniref:Uncharacterized protein n=1 Tax=Amblyomma americanum TaxID=6943 RepID=A0AAQ4FH98_AMBAM